MYGMVRGDDDTDEDDTRIGLGMRVECKKDGPYNGKRGTVEGTLGDEVLHVDFGASALVDHRDYFEKVDHS